MPNTADGLLHVAFLDIGQGDCSVIKCPNGITIMIDCGNSRAGEMDPDSKLANVIEVLDQIADQKQLDVVILTHSDQDHFNKLGKVVTGRAIGTIYHSGDIGRYTNNDFWNWWSHAYPYNKGTGANVGAVNGITVNSTTPPENCPVMLVDGTKEGEGEPSCKVYVMASNVVAESQDLADIVNTASVVTLLVFGTDRIMIPGDATATTEKFLTSRYNDAWLKVDTLRVAHHGSDTSSTQTFVDKASPKVAVISCAINNGKYLLPKKVIVDRYIAIAEGTDSHAIRYYDPTLGAYPDPNPEIMANVTETELNGAQIFEFQGK